MARATDDERRLIEGRLRELAGRKGPYEIDCRLAEAVMGPDFCETPCDECLSTVLTRLADLIKPEEVTGETSDGYHTFDELYDHRAKLFSVIVRDHREIAWKSRLHHDGTMYDGMFIVGVETPGGQATYHYDVDPYWGIFDCEELDRAPEWDGHTPRQSIDRIAALGPSCDRGALLRLAGKVFEDTEEDVRCEDLVSSWYAGEALRDVASKIREACGVVA